MPNKRFVSFGLNVTKTAAKLQHHAALASSPEVFFSKLFEKLIRVIDRCRVANEYWLLFQNVVVRPFS